jgi:hypothetical protein
MKNAAESIRALIAAGKTLKTGEPATSSPDLSDRLNLKHPELSVVRRHSETRKSGLAVSGRPHLRANGVRSATPIATLANRDSFPESNGVEIGGEVATTGAAATVIWEGEGPAKLGSLERRLKQSAPTRHGCVKTL